MVRLTREDKDNMYRMIVIEKLDSKTIKKELGIADKTYRLNKAKIEAALLKELNTESITGILVTMFNETQDEDVKLKLLPQMLKIWEKKQHVKTIVKDNAFDFDKPKTEVI